MTKETVVIRTASGDMVNAAIEESEGTDLPKVEVGTKALVWTLDGKSIVATSGSLFESTMAGAPTRQTI